MYTGRCYSCNGESDWFRPVIGLFFKGRTRQWFTVEEAAQRLSHKPVQVSYLDLLKREQDLVSWQPKWPPRHQLIRFFLQCCMRSVQWYVTKVDSFRTPVISGEKKRLTERALTSWTSTELFVCCHSIDSRVVS